MQKIEIAFSSYHLPEAHTCCSNVEQTLCGTGMTLRMVHGRQCANSIHRNGLKTIGASKIYREHSITSSNFIHRHIKWRKIKLLEAILEYVRLWNQIKPPQLYIIQTKCWKTPQPACGNKIIATSIQNTLECGVQQAVTAITAAQQNQRIKKILRLEKGKYGSGSVSRTVSFIKDCVRFGKSHMRDSNPEVKKKIINAIT